jgi:hypothetical protein
MEEFKSGGTSSESIENLSDWKALKEQAPAQAEALLQDIAGFDAMNISEKIATLQALLSGLEGDNKNRFIYREITIHIERIEEEERHRIQMERLGVNV